MVNPRKRDPDPPPSSDRRGAYAWDINYRGDRERDRFLGSDMSYRGISPTRSSARSPPTRSRRHEEIDWEGKYHVVKERETLLDSQLQAKSIMIEEQVDEISALQSHCDTMTKALQSKEDETQLLQQAIESIEQSHLDSLGGREPQHLIQEVHRLEGMLHTSHAEGRKVYIELKQTADENQRHQELIKSLQDELRSIQHLHRVPVPMTTVLHPPVQTPPPSISLQVPLPVAHDHPAVIASIEPQLLSFSPPRSGRSKEKPPNLGTRRSSSSKKASQEPSVDPKRPQSASARARKGQDGIKSEPNSVEHARALQQIASLTDSLRCLQADNDILRSEITVLKANPELTSLRDERARFHSEGDRAAKEIQRLRSELETTRNNTPGPSATNKINELLEENRRLKDDLSSLHNKTKNSPSDDNLTNEIKTLRLDYDNSCRKVDYLNDENEKLKSNLNKLSINYNDSCNDLQDQKNKTSELESRNRQLSTSDDEIELLKARISALNRERDILKKKSTPDLNSLEEINLLKSEISNLKSDISTNEQLAREREASQRHENEMLRSRIISKEREPSSVSPTPVGGNSENDLHNIITSLRNENDQLRSAPTAGTHLIDEMNNLRVLLSSLKAENQILESKLHNNKIHTPGEHATQDNEEILKLMLKIKSNDVNAALLERNKDLVSEINKLRNQLNQLLAIENRNPSKSGDGNLQDEVASLREILSARDVNPALILRNKQLVNQLDSMRGKLSQADRRMSSSDNSHLYDEIAHLRTMLKSNNVDPALIQRNKQLVDEIDRLKRESSNPFGGDDSRLRDEIARLKEQLNRRTASSSGGGGGGDNTHLHDEISHLRNLLKSNNVDPALVERNRELADTVDRLKREKPATVDNTHLNDEIAYLRNMLSSRDVNPSLIDRNKELVDEIDRLKNEPNRRPPSGGDDSRLRDEIARLKEQLNGRPASSSGGGGGDNTHLHDEISHLRNLLKSNNVDPALVERNRELADTVDRLKREKPATVDNTHLNDEIAYLRNMLSSRDVNPSLIDRNKELVNEIDRLKNEPNRRPQSGGDDSRLRDEIASLKEQLRGASDNTHLHDEISHLRDMLKSNNVDPALLKRNRDLVDEIDKLKSSNGSNNISNADLLNEISFLKDKLSKTTSNNNDKHLQDEISYLRSVLRSKDINPVILDRNKELADEIHNLRDELSRQPSSGGDDSRLREEISKLKDLLSRKNESTSNDNTHLHDEILYLRNMLKGSDVNPLLIQRNKELIDEIDRLKNEPNRRPPSGGDDSRLRDEIARLKEQLNRRPASSSGGGGGDNTHLHDEISHLRDMLSNRDVNPVLIQRNKDLIDDIDRLKNELSRQPSSGGDDSRLRDEIARLKEQLNRRPASSSGGGGGGGVDNTHLHDEISHLRNLLKSNNVDPALVERNRELADTVDRLKREKPATVDNTHLNDEIAYLRNMLSSRDVNPSLIDRNKELVDEIDRLKNEPNRRPPSGGDDSRLRDEIARLKEQLNRRPASSSGGGGGGGGDNTHLHDEISHLRDMLSNRDVNPVLIQRNKDLIDDIDRLKNELSRQPSSGGDDSRLRDEIARLKEQLNGRPASSSGGGGGGGVDNTHLHDEISHLRNLLKSNNVDPALVERNRELADTVDRLKREKPPAVDNTHLNDEISHLRNMLSSRDVNPSLIDRNKELVDEIDRLKNEPNRRPPSGGDDSRLRDEIARLKEQLNRRPASSSGGGGGDNTHLHDEISHLRNLLKSNNVDPALVERNRELADTVDRLKREKPATVDNTHLNDEISHLRNMLSSRDVNPSLIDRNKELVNEIDRLKKNQPTQYSSDEGSRRSRNDDISPLRNNNMRNTAHLHDEISQLRNILKSKDINPTVLQRNQELSETVNKLKAELGERRADGNNSLIEENAKLRQQVERRNATGSASNTHLHEEIAQLKRKLSEGKNNNNKHLHEEIYQLRDMLQDQNVNPALAKRNKELATQVDRLTHQLDSSNSPSGDSRGSHDAYQLHEEISHLKRLLSEKQSGVATKDLLLKIDRLSKELDSRDRRPSSVSAGSSANAELIEEVARLREQLENNTNEAPDLANEISVLRSMLASEQNIAPAMLERHKQLLDEIIELRAFIAASPDLNPSLVRKNQFLAHELERRSESREESHLGDEITRLRSLLSSKQDVGPALIERNKQLSDQVRQLKKLKNPIFNSSEWLNTELAKLSKGSPITAEDMVKELKRLESSNASLQQQLLARQQSPPPTAAASPGVNEALMERNKELALELMRVRSQTPMRESSSERHTPREEVEKLQSEIGRLQNTIREQSSRLQSDENNSTDPEIIYLKQQLLAVAEQLQAAEQSEDKIRDLTQKNTSLSKELQSILQREKSTSSDANELLDEVARLRLELQNASSDSQQLQDLKIATDQLMQQIHGKADVPSELKPVTNLLLAAQSHQKACKALMEVTDSTEQKSDRSTVRLHEEASDLEIECEDLHRDVYKFGWKAAVKLSEDISSLQRKIVSQDKEVRKLVAKRTTATDSTSAMELTSNATDLREDCNYIRELLSESIQSVMQQGSNDKSDRNKTTKELENDIQKLQNDYNELQKKHRSLEDENEILESKLQKLTKETTDRHNSAIHGLEDRIEELQEDNQYLIDKLKDYPEEIDELKRKITSLTNSNDILRKSSKTKDIRTTAAHILWKCSIRSMALKYFMRWQERSKTFQVRKKISNALLLGRSKDIIYRFYSAWRRNAAIKKLKRIPGSTQMSIKQRLSSKLFRTTTHGRITHCFLSWMAFVVRSKTDNPNREMSNFHKFMIGELLGTTTNKGKLQFYFNKLRMFSRRKAQEADTLHWLTILWQTKTQGAMSLFSHHAIRLGRTYFSKWQKYLALKKKLHARRQSAQCLMMMTARGTLRVCYNKLSQYVDLITELRRKEGLRNQALSALFTRSLISLLRHRYQSWVKYNTLRKEEGFYWRQQSLAGNAANTLFVSSIISFARKYFRRLENYSTVMKQFKKQAAQRRAICDCLVARSSRLKLQKAYLRWYRVLTLKKVKKIPVGERQKLLLYLTKQSLNSMRRLYFRQWEALTKRAFRDSNRNTDMIHAAGVLLSLTKKGLLVKYYHKLKTFGILRGNKMKSNSESDKQRRRKHRSAVTKKLLLETQRDRLYSAFIKLLTWALRGYQRHHNMIANASHSVKIVTGGRPEMRPRLY